LFTINDCYPLLLLLLLIQSILVANSSRMSHLSEHGTTNQTAKLYIPNHGKTTTTWELSTISKGWLSFCKTLCSKGATPTRKDVDKTIFELVDWQTCTDKFHGIDLHAGQPLKQMYTSRLLTTS